MAIFIHGVEVASVSVGAIPAAAVYVGNRLVWSAYREHVVRIGAVGSDQKVAVPAWAKLVDVVIIGGGAGGSTGKRAKTDENSSYGGRAAAWVTSTVALPPNPDVRVTIGDGGFGGTGFPPTFGGYNAGSDGGASTVSVNGNVVVRAAGGAGVTSTRAGADAPAVNAFGFSHPRAAAALSGALSGAAYGGGGSASKSGPSPRAGGPGYNGFAYLRFRNQ